MNGNALSSSRNGSAPGRLMGLDVGDKRLGVALSDELGLTAQPHKTLERKNTRQDFEQLRGIVKEYQVVAIVVGLPRNMNGTMGRQAGLVSDFAGKIEKDLGVPVILWDERLSTVAAERVLLDADVSRAKRKNRVDRIAAALILQGYLDSEGSRVYKSAK